LALPASVIGPAGGGLLHGDDAGDEITGFINKRTTAFEVETRTAVAWQRVQHAGDGLGVFFDGRDDLLGGLIRVMQRAERGEAAAEVQVAQTPAVALAAALHERDEFFSGGFVGVRFEDVGADVRVQALQTQAALALGDAADGTPGLAVLDAEAKLAPHRLDARIEPAADGDVDAASLLLRDGVEQQQLVPVIDLDHRAFAHGEFEAGAGFVRSVEDDVASGDAVAACFFILKLAHHLGDAALAVEDAADGVEVVGFVAPREARVRIAALESFTSAADFLTQRALGKNEERRAETSGEVGDGLTPSMRSQTLC
jgi:hypothetical protein